MDKRSSYRSTKALGVIYDKVAKQPIEFLPDWEHDFDQRILTRHAPSDEILAEVRKIKSQYDTAVRRILTQQDLSTEFELWTSFAMSKPAVGSDYKRQEDLSREYDALKARFREVCYEAAGGTSSETLDPFVVAMYQVTEEETKIALREHLSDDTDATMPWPLNVRSMPLISFPWIFHWVMLRVALGDAYRSKKSRMGIARRSDNANAQQVAVPKLPEISKLQIEEVSTKLPDGTLLHRGQPLNLFHTNEYDAYDQAGTDEESDGDGKPMEEAGEGAGQEDETTSDADVEESCAMDRLAKLIDFGAE